MYEARRAKFLVVCHDAGSTLLIAHWLKKSNDTIFAVYGPAQKIFNQESIKYISDPISSILNSTSFDCLITGTGWMTSIEIKAIKFAKEKKIYSIAVIDHWVNYMERFRYKQKHYLPNEIWVSDQYAYNISKKVFSNRTKITLKPNPLNEIINYKIELAAKQCHINQKRRTFRILLLMEPIRKVWHVRKTKKLPELEALEWFFDNLREIFALLDLADKTQGITLSIRNHPSEDTGKYMDLIDSLPKDSSKYVEMSLISDVIDDILLSDVIMGCETQAMVLAIKANKKVYSLLPPWSPLCSLPHQEINHLRYLI